MRINYFKLEFLLGFEAFNPLHFLILSDLAYLLV